MVFAYLPHLNDSLWLDEFASYHASQGTLWQAFAFRWQNLFVSPLYFSAVWLAASSLGAAEWALRIPTVVFAALNCYMLFLIGKKLFNREVGLYTVLIFLSFPNVIAQFSYARPYSLGVFCAMCAIYFWLRWAELGRFRDGLITVVAVVAAIYAHITFAAVAIPLLAILGVAKKKPRTHIQLFYFSLIALFLLSPLVAGVADIWSHKSFLALAGRGLSLYSVIHDLLGPQLFVALAALILFSCRFGLQSISTERSLKQCFIILLVWAIVPILLGYSLISLAGSGNMPSRYLFLVLPAFSLLISIGIVSLGSSFAQYVTILFTLAAGLFSYTKFYYPSHFEDWRSAIAFAKPLLEDKNSTFLFYSGWPETNQIERLTQQPVDAGMLAPLRYYGIDTSPIFIPYSPALSASQEYLAQQLKLGQRPKRKLVLLSCFSIANYYAELAKYFFPSAWRAVGERRFGNVVVVVLEEWSPDV